MAKAGAFSRPSAKTYIFDEWCRGIARRVYRVKRDKKNALGIFAFFLHSPASKTQIKDTIK